MEGDGAM